MFVSRTVTDSRPGRCWPSTAVASSAAADAEVGGTAAVALAAGVAADEAGFADVLAEVGRGVEREVEEGVAMWVERGAVGAGEADSAAPPAAAFGGRDLTLRITDSAARTTARTTRRMTNARIRRNARDGAAECAPLTDMTKPYGQRPGKRRILATTTAVDPGSPHRLRRFRERWCRRSIARPPRRAS